MNGDGAYEGEMNEVVLFETALRAAVPTRPDPKLGTTLVPRLAEVARAATLEAEAHPAPRRGEAPRSRFALVARVGIAVALIPLVLAGLAFAGVTVPGPARSAFDSVGITLPNQPAEHADGKRNGQGPAHSGNGGADTDATTTGKTDKGNSAAAHKHALEQHKKARGKALGHDRGRAIGLSDATPPGQGKTKTEKETGPPPHSNAGGNSATHTTTHTVPQHTTPATPGNNGNGQANGHANGHSK
jgi:hypothetical protein